MCDVLRSIHLNDIARDAGHTPLSFPRTHTSTLRVGVCMQMAFAFVSILQHDKKSNVYGLKSVVNNPAGTYFKEGSFEANVASMGTAS